MATDNINRIRRLDALLAILDSPKEGDEVSFTMRGDTTKYRGVIKKKASQDRAALYQVVSKTQPSPQGVIDTIEFKGKIFKTGGWKPI
jgi:hypothetical protein